MFDILDSKQVKKGVIDAIFNEIPKIELPQLKTIGSAKTRRIILISITITLVLGSFILISFKGTPETPKEDKELAAFEEFSDDYEYSAEEYNNTFGDSEEVYAQLIPKESRSIESFSIRHPVSTKPAYSPTITDISWEAPESLIKKENYTKFLQLMGKNVKLNLQNDLLLVNDVPANKVTKVDINIAANGNVNSVKMVSSSGSPSIDASIKKVIMDTLRYMKPPSHGIISKPISVTLLIELN